MALASNFELDDDQDDAELDWLAGLMAATPAEPLPATILERLAATRPRWHARAACRGRRDLSWFRAEDKAAAKAICHDCPVQADCSAAGKAEPLGVWAGLWRDRHLGRRAAPCAACGEERPLQGADSAPGATPAGSARPESPVAAGPWAGCPPRMPRLWVFLVFVASHNNVRYPMPRRSPVHW